MEREPIVAVMLLVPYMPVVLIYMDMLWFMSMVLNDICQFMSPMFIQVLLKALVLVTLQNLRLAVIQVFLLHLQVQVQSEIDLFYMVMRY